MSIIFGKNAGGQPQRNPKAPRAEQNLQGKNDQFIQNPPPPIAYQGLRQGQEGVIEYEPNQAIPVDGSNQLLRTFSPFILKIEPPAVFGNEPAFVDQTNTKGIGLYSAAFKGTKGFENSRASLSQENAYGLSSRGGSADQFVSRSAPAPVTGNDPTDPPGSLGRPTITDLYTALDISLQLSAALNAPPLVLLINPQTMSMSFTKIQQFQDRSRFGYIFQAWGEEQPKLSISARCGAFISGGRGVHFASKRDSAAWQNLMNAFTFYRNNGYIYDSVGKSNAHHFVGALSIHYDGWIYFGHMESFSYGYEEGNQLGGVTFTMEFVVSRMIDSSKSNQVVQPMRSPTSSLSDFKLAQVRDLNPESALSVGGGNNVDARLFEGGQKPTTWIRATDTPVNQTGDPDFVAETKPGVLLAPSPSPSRGTKGFQAISDEPGIIPQLTTRPEPFRV